MIDCKIYSEAIDYIIDKYRELKIFFSLQSNGVHISDEYIDFFCKYDINVGISIDGSKKVHDMERRTCNGGETYEIVWKNIDRLLDKGIRVSCLMVLTQNAINEDYSFLNRFAEKGIHLKINPLLNYGETVEHPDLILKKGDYARYLIGLYKYVIEKDIDIMIAPNDDILKAILHDQNIHECSFSMECNKHFLCIDYKGDIYPCGKFSDMDLFKIGNIRDDREFEFSCLAIKKLLARRNEDKPSKCCSCKYMKKCNAGCNAEAMIDGNFDGEPNLCDDYYELFEFFYHEGLVLLRQELKKQIMSLEGK